jgi:hypothetical protein
VAQRVHPANHAENIFTRSHNDGLRAAGNLAEPDDALIGADFHKNDLGFVHELVRGPSALLQRDGQRMSDDFGDLHGNDEARAC